MHIVSAPRGLVRAFAISIALHVFLLWPAVAVWREAAPAAPLIASLHPSAAPVAPSVPAIAPKPSTADRPAPPSSLPTTPERAIANAPTQQDLTTRPTVGSETSAAPEVPPAVYSALPPSSGVDAEGLRSYRLALAREARRYKRYPTRAIEAGWSGTAELRVSVTPGRGAPVAQLAKSSGHAALDEAALEMLRLAMPATPVPAPLQERAFSVDLPIVFELPE